MYVRVPVVVTDFLCSRAQALTDSARKKSIKCLKQCLFFAKKNAKIMLIFLKSARGLHKNAHFFPIFLNIEYYIFQIFSYIFQQQNGRVRSRAISALDN